MQTGAACIIVFLQSMHALGASTASSIRFPHMKPNRLSLALFKSFLREAAHCKKTHTYIELISPVDAKRWGVHVSEV